MPLNAEEKYEQAKFERNNPPSMFYTADELDKLFEQRSAIIEACRKVSTETEFSDGLFKDKIMRIVGWRL